MALDSMREIFEKAAAGQIPFWQVILETDMEQRQVTAEAVHGKNAGYMAGYAGIRDSLPGDGTLPQRPGGRRRRENAAICRKRQRPLRRVPAGGGRHGIERRRVQRLYAEDRGGADGGSLRRAACGAGAAVSGGDGIGGADPSGAVCRLRHRGGHRLPGLHCRCRRRLSGGDRHRVRHGGGGADLHSGRQRGSDRPRGGHGAEKSSGSGVRPGGRVWWRSPA